VLKSKPVHQLRKIFPVIISDSLTHICAEPFGCELLHGTQRLPNFCASLPSIQRLIYPDLEVTLFDLTSFYPRDAMLARVIGTATCPSVRLSVCHALVLCQKEKERKRHDFFTIW